MNLKGGFVGHEADAVVAAAVVETGGFQNAAVVGEAGGELDVGEGISRIGPLEGESENFPASDFRGVDFSPNLGGEGNGCV